jgi:myosin heavy subunit
MSIFKELPDEALVNELVRRMNGDYIVIEQKLESERAAHIETRESLRSREAILREQLERQTNRANNEERMRQHYVDRLTEERQAHEATRQNWREAEVDVEKLRTTNDELRRQLDDYAKYILEEDALNESLRTTNDRLRKALEKIASGEGQYDGIVNVTAREALSADQNLAINDQNVATDPMTRDDHENTLLNDANIREEG